MRTFATMPITWSESKWAKRTRKWIHFSAFCMYPANANIDEMMSHPVCIGTQRASAYSHSHSISYSEYTYTHSHTHLHPFTFYVHIRESRIHHYSFNLDCTQKYFLKYQMEYGKNSNAVVPMLGNEVSSVRHVLRMRSASPPFAEQHNP